MSSLSPIDGPSAIRRRALIVEDESRLRDMLTRVTRDMEFVVTAVATAEAALARLNEQSVDVVIADLNLPGMLGLELCEEIRRSWPETQLIILTGFGSLDAAQSAIRLNVADFLTKPCSLGDLEAALDRALRRKMHSGDATTAPLLQLDVEVDEPAGPERPRTLEEIEREHVFAALARCDGNRIKASEELGISVRTLYYRLNEYERRGFVLPRRQQHP